jgi:hypothetical protein
MNIYILLSNLHTNACRDVIGEWWLGIKIARKVALNMDDMCVGEEISSHV